MCTMDSLLSEQNLTCPASPTPDTLTELLRRRATQQPHQLAYTFLVDGQSQEITLTYQQLDQRARAIAAKLQMLGMQGQRALLLYSPGLDYIAGFFACLYAGVVAVPAYPPRANRPAPRLSAIVLDSQSAVALTSRSLFADMERRFKHSPELQAMHWLTTDDMPLDQAELWQAPALSHDTLAFLQYTSGSTAAPKGVMLTHRNLLYNLALIHHSFGASEDSQGVIWLPPYHDMGLIGGILEPLYGGFPVVLMSPIAFLQQPRNWLRAISHYRATISGGPDFAYAQCLDKIGPAERADLDLRSWDVAFTGAEPIRPDTLDRFVDAFLPSGFRREAFYPCYGLAESSLIVSGGQKTLPPLVKNFNATEIGRNCVVEVPSSAPDGQALVSCGPGLPGQQVVIVNPETLSVCPDGLIGEVWVSGTSVAQGYWNQPELTQAAFGAYLADASAGPFLRTGDMGFLRDDELYIAGRLKDLIIIRGRNHYPQDIELTVERCHPALQSGRCAAFSVDVEDEERLVVVQELNRHYRKADVMAEVAVAVRQAVVDAHELRVHAIVLIKPWSIPTTSSGKIQRHVCCARYLDNTLDVVASDVLSAVPLVDAAEGELVHLTPADLLDADAGARLELLTSYLKAQTAQVLRVSAFDVDGAHSLGALGLDSLMVIDLKHTLETNLEVELTMSELLGDTTLADLARDILARIEAPPVAPSMDLVATQSDLTATTYPLSHGQRSLWFIYQLAPDTAAYNVPVAVRIHSALNTAALRASCEHLLARHAALRTTFTISAQGPQQQLHADLPLDFVVVDATAWSAEFLQEHLIQEANRPCDLQKGPLLRVRVFKKSEQEYVFLMLQHHIITDFWSLALLIEELRHLYPAACRGALPAPAPVEFNYVDYARWQTQMLNGPRGAQLRAYWMKQLAGDLPVLQLPLDHSRPPVQTYNGALHTLRLSRELTANLTELAQMQGVTLYMTLLAAFKVLLYRYTNQRDILLGSLSAGRSHAQVTDILGYFVNPLVLRSHPAPTQSFLEFLEQVRETVLDAFEHQDYPFDALVDQLQPVRDYSRSPLFQVMFVYQKAYKLDKLGMTPFALDIPGAKMQLAGLDLESLPLQRHVSQFDLTLTMGEAEGQLVALFEYNTDLFEVPTIARMAAHLEMLLKGITAYPQQHLVDLPLLTYTEQVQYLSLWNGDSLPQLLNTTVQSLFDAQASRTPAALAVVSAEQHLTYAELDRRATQLALYLQSLGVGQESVVGICLDRSIDMIVSVLAVLKSGGAYLPLDPTYPLERLEFMLTNVNATLLLSQTDLLPAMPALESVVYLDSDLPAIEAQAATHFSSLGAYGDAKNLACIIYTSGSTGMPKAVLLENGSIVNLINSFIQSYQPTPQDRILPLTSVASASFVGEILPLLCAGGTLVLAPETEFLDIDAFSDLLTRQAVTIVSTVPSFITGLNARQANLAQLRLLLSGGEALTSSDIDYLLQSVTIINSYGVTETTVCSTYYALQSSDAQGGTGLPIGRPIINTEAYVLDENLNHLPINCPGELYISGRGLARGYFGNPALTAQRFVPNPYRPGARMYRTGDLVRRLSDGSLEYLQRVDHQVKIRGFRIELGEIEATIKSHADVCDVIVLAREDSPSNKHLVAYIAYATPSLAQDALYAWLVERLPPYMVPAHMIMMEALPLTPNGKVDIKALPEPEGVRPALGAAYVAPHSELQRAIVAIWQAELQVDRVGIHDNFFELGGNSLLIAQVHQRLRAELDMELSLVDMFKYPTIHTLTFSQSDKNTQGLTKVKQETSQRKAAQDRRREKLKQRRQSLKR